MSSIYPNCPFLSIRFASNIVSPSGNKPFSNALAFLFYRYRAVMYLLVYPSLATPPRAKSAPQAQRQAAAIGVDFVTPDGTIVPRAAGEAALLGHTAVLIGGL